MEINASPPISSKGRVPLKSLKSRTPPQAALQIMTVGKFLVGIRLEEITSVATLQAKRRRNKQKSLTGQLNIQTPKIHLTLLIKYCALDSKRNLQMTLVLHRKQINSLRQHVVLTGLVTHSFMHKNCNSREQDISLIFRY